MKKITKSKTRKENLNECARILYATQGYEVLEGYDFQTAPHPQEQAMFAMAVRTCSFWSLVFKEEKKV